MNWNPSSAVTTEDVVGEAAGIGILLADFLTGVGQKQAIEDVGRFVRWPGWSVWRRVELVGDVGIGLPARVHGRTWR